MSAGRGRFVCMVGLSAAMGACGAAVQDPADKSSDPVDMPRWSGTQIGDEGDEGCATVATPWASAEAPDGITVDPEALRADLAGTWNGVLESTWQGAADATLTLTPDGQVFHVEQVPVPHMPCEEHWLEVETRIRVDAPDLLVLEETASLRIRVANVRVDAADLDGILSPGELPEDGSALALQVLGAVETGGAVALYWWLERPSGEERAEAGTLYLD